MDRQLRLLAIDPQERFGYPEVVRTLDGQHRRYSSGAPVLPRVHGTRLVGRGREVRQLLDAFSSVRAGVPSLSLVVGRAGMGKSALVHHFLDQIAARDGALVLRARCDERESLAYKAIDPLIDALAMQNGRL